jgi:hypothetical protein
MITAFQHNNIICAKAKEKNLSHTIPRKSILKSMNQIAMFGHEM